MTGSVQEREAIGREIQTAVRGFAAMTPYWLHRRLVSRIFEVPENDVFPTFYGANTLSAMRKAFCSVGFRERELDIFNHDPAYLMFSPVLFRLGVLYERLTLFKALRSLQSSNLAVFEKEDMAGDAGDWEAAVVRRESVVTR